MKTLLVFLIGIVLVGGCRTGSEELVTIREDFGSFFDAYEVDGSILIYDRNQGRYLGYHPERYTQAFIPASTYKIFNSLIALETGVIADEEEVIAWDGVERGWEQWNRDHTLRSAIAYSTVWFYQELARRIGEERMQHYVDLAGYGNRDISGGIDVFWLEGGLRITSKEQIELLKRLHDDALPFSQRSMDIVKDILVLERGEGYVLRGKIGWGRGQPADVGWFVGYLEQDDNVYFFATNIAIVDDEDQTSRQAVTRDVLMHLGLL